VLEAGISATSLSWTLVQPKVAEFTRVVSYDRAGLGRSDAGTPVVSAAVHASTLRSMLRALEIAPPYVLVGHSYGSFVIRAYAARHPEEVAGLVLVDPIDAAEWSNPSPQIEYRLQRGVRFSRLGAILARVGFVRFVLSLLTGRAPGTAGRIARLFGDDAARTLGGLLDEVRKLPQDTWPVVMACWCQPKCFHALAAHLAGLPASAREVAASPLGDIPTTIVSAALGWASQSGGHVHLAGLSTRSRLLVAEHSGHWVQADEPEVIVEAIRDLVDAARPDR
jgi:pimeloyl-ACP methyl ester carboxylesterase